jgi:hypothetical protein
MLNYILGVKDNECVVHQDKIYNRYLLVSAAHAALIHKSKNLLARNQENVSEWGFAYTHELLFITKRVGINKAKTIIIERQLDIAVNSSVGVKRQSLYT